MGVPEVFVLEDGDAIVVDGDDTWVERNAAEAGYVYLDGSGVGDVQGGVLRDRGHLADDGVVVVTVAFNAKTREVISGPDLNSHGFMDDPAALLAKAADAVRQVIIDFEHESSEQTMQLAIRRSVRRVLKAETGRRPVVLPVVIEL